MLDNCNKNGCKFTDEIVSYMYGEIGEPERSKFEDHLLDCSVCTDEFAGISNARFSVFEWHKEEFADLPTPNIVIPYGEPAVAAGFFAGLRDLLTLSGWPAAATVAAGLIVSIGLGFAAINYVGGEKDIASNTQTNAGVPPTKGANDVGTPQADNLTNNNSGTVVATKAGDQELRPLGTSSTVRRARVTNASQRVRNTPVRNQSATTARAPVLTNYDDADDKSLRLSDLFDDGGAE